jgi:hypothetical protein
MNKTKLQHGGKVAVKISANITIILYIIHTAGGEIKHILDEGIIVDFVYILNSVSSGVIFGVLIVLVFSIPAFLCGQLLFIIFEKKKNILSWNLKGLGGTIGFGAGMILAALIIIPTYNISAYAHGGFGFNPSSEIPKHVFLGLEIVGAATLTGVLTEKKYKQISLV